MVPADRSLTVAALIARQGLARSSSSQLICIKAAGPAGAYFVDAMSADVVSVDVRPDLRAGHEPFAQIMQATKTVLPGGTLRVIARFEPKPLYTVLAAHGFAHVAHSLADGGWEVVFQHGPPAAEVLPVSARSPSVGLPLRFVLTAALGIVLGWPGLPATMLTTQLEKVYGLLGILGVVTFTIMGFLYKSSPPAIVCCTGIACGRRVDRTSCARACAGRA